MRATLPSTRPPPRPPINAHFRIAISTIYKITPPNLKFDTAKVNLIAPHTGDTNRVEVIFSNPGGVPLIWSVDPPVYPAPVGDDRTATYRFTPTGGTIAPNGQATVTVFAQRARLPEFPKPYTENTQLLLRTNTENNIALPVSLSILPGEAKDSLTIVSSSPPAGQPVQRGDRIRFQAAVLENLVTRPRATLLLLLTDQNGNNIDFTNLSTSRCCSNANPPATFDLTVVPDTEIPPGVTMVRMQAAFLMSGTSTTSAEIFFRSPAIQFPVNVDNLKITDGSAVPKPDPAQPLFTDAPVGFSAQVEYQLIGTSFGNLMLSVLDADGKVMRSSEPQRVESSEGAGKKTFSVPPGLLPAGKLRLVARLVDASSGVLYGQSAPVEYTVIDRPIKLKIELYSSGIGSYTPFSELPVLMGSLRLFASLGFQTLGARMEIRIPGDAASATWELRVNEKLTNRERPLPRSGPLKLKWGDVQRGNPDAPILVDRPIDSDTEIPPDVDQWEFVAVLTMPDGTEYRSEPVTFDIERVWVTDVNPKPGVLERKVPDPGNNSIVYNLQYQLEYNIHRLGTTTLKMISGAAGLTSGDHQEIRKFDGPAFNSVASGKDGTFPIAASFSTLDNTSEMYSYFTIANQRAGEVNLGPSSNVIKFKFAPAPVDPTTAGNSILGVMFSEAFRSAGAPPNISVDRTGIQAVAFFGQPIGLPLGFNSVPKQPQRSAAQQADIEQFLGVPVSWNFDPPIPASQFSATVQFEYGGVALPDDPNFDESKLEIVSFDPASGQFLRYATTLDRVAKTASARTEGLARFYSLGMFGPFRNQTLVFPIRQSYSGFSGGLAAVNLGDSAADTQVRVFSEGGAGPDPQALSIRPSAQSANLAADVNAGNSWARLVSNRNTLAGVDLMGDRSSFEVLPATKARAGPFVLPQVEWNAQTFTELHIVNASNVDSRCTLALKNRDGSNAGQQTVQAPAYGKKAWRLKDLFPDAGDSFAGSLFVLAEQPSSVAAVLVSPGALAAMSGQQLGSKRLVAPHFQTSGTWTAALNVANAGQAPAQVKVNAFGANGSALGQAQSFTLAAGETRRLSMAAVIPGGSGSIVVESDQPTIAGNLDYVDNPDAPALRSLAPFEGNPGTFMALPWVQTAMGFSSRLAVMNAGTSAASVNIRVVKSDGSLAGTSSQMLAPGGRLLSELPALVAAAANQTGGYVTVTAAQPLAAALLIESANALATVPGVRAPDGVAAPGGGPPAGTATISVTPPALGFGSVTLGQSKDLPVTIANTGTAPLTVSNISSNNPQFQPAPASATVAAGSSTAISVRFTPTAQGTVAGSLAIPSNDPKFPVVTVAMTGSGQPAANPAPVVTAISPATAAAGGPTFTLTVTGSGFVQASQVEWGGAPRPMQFIGDKELRATIAALDISNPGPVAVTVSSPAPGGGRSAPTTFTVTGIVAPPNPAPAITALSPDRVTAGGTDFVLSVRGSGFVAASVVEWNGSARATSFASGGEVRAQIPGADIRLAGDARVTVFTPAPGGGRSSAATVSIAAVVPPSGPQVFIHQLEQLSCPESNAYVSVLDKDGNFLDRLNTSNLSCSEDGQGARCSVDTVAAAGKQLSLALVLGTNSLGSADNLTLLKNAAKGLVNLMGTADRVAVVQVETRATPVQTFTESKLQSSGAIDSMQEVGTGSALYDGVNLALISLRGEAAINRHQAIVVLAGAENSSGSERDAAALVERARAQGVPVFTWAIGPGAGNAGLEGFLRGVASATQGTFASDAGMGNLFSTMQKLGQQFQGMYVMNYFSTHADGASHTLTVNFTGPQGTATGTRTFVGCRP